MAVTQDEVEVLVREIYDPPPAVQHHRTSISSVFVLTFADGAEKILKANNDDRFSEGVRREQRVLPSLRSLGLNVPCVELTQEDRPCTRFAFSVMPRNATRTLSDWRRTDQTAAAPVYVDAGAWLAKLHLTDPLSVPEAILPAEAHDLGVGERIWIQGLVTEAELVELGSEALFDEFAAMQERPRESLIHGDYNAGQVMIKDGAISYVVDWDFAQHGRPMRDLGLCLAYANFYDRATDEAVQLKQGYEEIRPLSPVEEEECLLWQLYTLLRVTAGLRLAGQREISDWGIGLISDLLDLRLTYARGHTPNGGAPQRRRER